MSPAMLLTLAMHCAASVHPSTSLDVARVESGYNPYAIAEIVPEHERKPGDKDFITHMPDNKEVARSIINQIEAKGRRYSVGLMQITSTNFHRYGVTATDLLDPCKNLSVYEQIITDCYRRGGTLQRALSCYYSGNFRTGQQPESALSKTSYVQRIGYSPPVSGYTVPSTKTDQNHAPTPEKAQAPSVRWPSKIVRGDFNPPGAEASQPEIPVYYPSKVVRGEFITFDKETTQWQKVSTGFTKRR